MAVIENILALIVTLGILVTFHELGHYVVARYFGVKVLRFSVGFGKALYTRRMKPVPAAPIPEGTVVRSRTNEPEEGTEFVIAALPLGGYVKMLDEREGYVADDQLHMAFNRKTPLQRMAIAAAGPAANLLLALVAYWILFTAGVGGVKPVLGDIEPQTPAFEAGIRSGQQVMAVDGTPVGSRRALFRELFNRIGDSGHISLRVANNEVDFGRVVEIPITSWLSDVEEPHPLMALGLSMYYPPIPAVIGGLIKGEAAIRDGFEVGDRVAAVNGEPVRDWVHWVELIRASPNQELNVTVDRNGSQRQLRVTPGSRESGGRNIGHIGASRDEMEFPADLQVMVTYPFYSAWIPAAEETWSMTLFTLSSIKKILVGDISPKNLSGPITIAQIATATAKSGLETFINFLAVLSISLCVINLLPIPVLDGGHILYCAAEVIFRRPVPERIQMWGLQVGIFLMVSIMLWAVFNDISRLL